MKRLFTFLIALLPLVASAYDFKYNGILYNVVSYTENTVEVDIKPDIWMDAYTGDVEIPSFVSYNGLKYTVIGLHDYAFNRCPYMTSIKLPNTLKYIGKEAFSECNQLFSITIPESVIQYGYNVFTRPALSKYPTNFARTIAYFFIISLESDLYFLFFISGSFKRSRTCFKRSDVNG